MRGTTKVGAGVLAAVVGYALLTSVNWEAFPGVRREPITSRVTPTSSEGRWAKLRGTWESGVAAITIVVGNNQVPPACHIQMCGENPYNDKIEVKTGHEIVFSIQANSYKGRATCLILAPGEDFGSKIPASARQEATTGGHVTCTRTVTW